MYSKSDMSLSKVIKDTVLNSSVAFVVSDVRPLEEVIVISNWRNFFAVWLKLTK